VAIKPQKGNRGVNIIPTIDLFFKQDIFNYPVFCFKHLQADYSLAQCDKDERAAFIEQLCMYSQMTWQQIILAPRHGLGSEKISLDSIRAPLPRSVTPDVTLLALRFDGKKPFVGYRYHFIFHVLYIDRGFTLYPH